MFLRWLLPAAATQRIDYDKIKLYQSCLTSQYDSYYISTGKRIVKEIASVLQSKCLV